MAMAAVDQLLQGHAIKGHNIGRSSTLAFKDDKGIVCIPNETKVGLHRAIHGSLGFYVVVVDRGRIQRRKTGTALAARTVVASWGGLEVVV